MNQSSLVSILAVALAIMDCSNATDTAKSCPEGGCASDVSTGVVDDELSMLQVRTSNAYVSAHAQLQHSKKMGDPDCACLGIQVEGETQIWDGTDKSTSVTYPYSYGSTCELGWCYVDPCKCSLAMTKSTQAKKNKKGKILAGVDYHHMPAFYSYATCGNGGDAGDSGAAYCKYSAEHWDAPLLGKVTCPCFGWYDRSGTVKLTVAGQSINYPAMTGGECMKWDKPRHPECLTDDKPDWCDSKWCWVDPDDCDLPDSPPQLFTRSPVSINGKPAYWSYATCGDKDPWASSLLQVSKITQAQSDQVKKMGDPDCACLGIQVEGETQIWDGTDKSTSVTYPYSYGSTCELGWCYVDPCKCSLAMTKSTQAKKNKKGKILAGVDYHHMPAFYSFATCGNGGDAGDSGAAYCKYSAEHWDAPLLGKVTCPCFGWYDRSGTVKLTVAGQSINYPAMTGGECMKWDKPRHPECLKDDKPDWCDSKWCWVDPDDCDLPDSPPQLFTRSPVSINGKPAYWSYATCGDKDPWASSLLQVSKITQAQSDQVKKMGDPDCACLGIQVEGETQIWDGTDKSTSVTYPYSYGSTCELGWCYVDPCKCSLAMTKSTQAKKNKKGKILAGVDYHHMPAFYSYATCGNGGDAGDSGAAYCKYSAEHWDAPLLGKATCPCFGWYDRSGTVKLTVAGQSINYPAMTGGECMKWDKPRHPECLTDDKPDWCDSKWCWVDPDDCDLPDSPPQLFTRSPVSINGKPAYWSYATCGDKDPWA